VENTAEGAAPSFCREKKKKKKMKTRMKDLVWKYIK